MNSGYEFIISFYWYVLVLVLFTLDCQLLSDYSSYKTQNSSNNQNSRKRFKSWDRSVVHSINEKKNIFLVKMDTSDHTIAATLYKTSKQVFVFFF